MTELPTRPKFPTPPPRRRGRLDRLLRGEATRAGALLFLLLAVVHHDVLFQGRSFVLTNHFNPLDYRVGPEAYGDDFVPGDVWLTRNLYTYANIRDPGGSWWQWEPSGEFLEEGLRRGEWPFWDPYVGGGAPAMANLTSAFFFPPYFLMVAVFGHTATVENVYLVALLWASSFFGYLFLRAHGLSFAASLAGGAGVMLIGSTVQHVGTIMGQSASCLTPVLYVTRRFLDTPDWRRGIILALSYAAAALASFPPVLLSVFGLTAFYTLLAVAAGDAGAPRTRVAVVWLIAVTLAVGLVAAYYVPAAALWRTAPSQVQAVYAEAGLETQPLQNIYQLLSSTAMGGVLVYIAPAMPPVQGPHVPYVGAALLLLALLAGAEGRRARTLLVFAAPTAVLILLKLFGIAPVQWIGHLPLLNHIHFAHYFGLPLGFLVVFLAALGFDRLQHGLVGTARALLAIGLILAFIESLWWVAGSEGAFRMTGTPYWVRDWKALATCGALAGIAVVVATRAHLRPAALGLLAAVLVAEGYYNGNYPSPRVWDIFDHPVPYMRYLRDHAGLRRVMPFGAPPANVNAGFDVFSVNSLMAYNPPRALELYVRYAGAVPSIFLREARELPPDPVLDRQNVGLVSVVDIDRTVSAEARARGYRRVYDDDYVDIYERTTPPRFFFSSDYVVAERTLALEMVATAPSRQVVLEQAPGVAASPNEPGDPAVRVLHYGLNGFVLEIDAPRPGLLYASENAFDGWEATVNGTPAPILTANYAFRAVPVAAGRARVEFRYVPPGLTAGLTASGASLAGLLALALTGARARWRRGRRG